MFDHVVVNDDLDHAYHTLRTIISEVRGNSNVQTCATENFYIYTFSVSQEMGFDQDMSSKVTDTER